MRGGHADTHPPEARLKSQMRMALASGVARASSIRVTSVDAGTPSSAAARSSAAQKSGSSATDVRCPCMVKLRLINPANMHPFPFQWPVHP